jgi:hypothetical protein
MKKPIKIIFLDVDGVLNGATVIDYTIYKIFYRLGLLKLHRKIFRYPYGVHEEKVRRLGKIVKETGAVCVMTSTWRGAYFSEDTTGRMTDIIKLKELMKKYHIDVIDKTGRDKEGRRGVEIIDWLVKHQDEYEYLSYCILDDENHDFNTFKDAFVLTTNNPYLSNGQYARSCHIFDADGLRRMHVKKAIKILNDIHSDPMAYYKKKYREGETSMYSMLVDEEYLPLTKSQIQGLLIYSGDDDFFTADEVLYTRRATKGLTGVY